MVAIYKDGKSGRWHISFRFGGKQVHKSLKTRNEKKAAAWKERIEETLLDLERGRFELSPNADFWEYVKSDGKRTNKLVIASSLTIQGLFRWYFDSLPEGTKVKKTGKVETIHANHFKRLLGAKTELSAITGQDLQEKYVNKRAKEKGRYGQRIDPSTIKKEICTFRMAWNRGYRQKVSGIHGPCPCVDLQYPKDRQKPPFQTRDQIEKTIARGGLSEADVKEIWDSLFLDQRQIEEVLEHVRNKPTRRHYFYPLLVFVSHTGARLSECLRSMVSDFDFCEKKVRIQEKKRRKSEETYRWVSMSGFLRRTMEEWFENHHPGGELAFCRVANRPFHEQTLHDDFEWFMKNSQWEVLKGFHTFRHSLASNLARAGIDQREIDALMGHQTEEMRQRYSHLFPEQRENAIVMVQSELEDRNIGVSG